MQLLKRYMDDGFIFWPLKVNFEDFKTCLNNMHPSIKRKESTVFKFHRSKNNFTRKQLS